MRLLVTGGAGFIGSAFVRRRLATTDDTITVLDKLTYAGSRTNLAEVESDPVRAARFRFVRGDICDAALVGPLVTEADAVLNFAAESHVDRSILDADAFLRTGVIGVHVLLEAVRGAGGVGGAGRPAHSGRPARFVQVSTDEVYGDVAEGLSLEDDALAPRSPYAAAKAAGELLCRSYVETFGLDIVVTRGANTYGPHQFPEKIVPLFVTNAVDARPLPLYGDGLQVRDWLYVDDHAEAVGFVLDHGRSGDAYNVPGPGEVPGAGSGARAAASGARAMTNRAVTEAILAELGRPWSLVRSVPDRPGHDRRYAMSGEKLASLGWRPAVPFAVGLPRTVAWYRDHEAWWRAIRDGEFEAYYERQYGRRLAESVEA